MRISTAQIFDSGSRGISRNQVDLFTLQNQMSTGRKVLTPADDPVASAQALVLTQAKAVSAQYIKNQQSAQGALGVVDAQLGAVDDLLRSVRDKVLQAGNTTLSNADRSAIVKELEERFSELLGIANVQDGTGDYLFAGYQGAVRPFSTTATGASYAGDDGQRLLQVDSSRQIAANVSGSAVFEQIRNGNGTFATAKGGNTALGTVNQGTAIIDRGSVNNQSLWKQALDAGFGDVKITFSVTAGVTEYKLYDVVSGLEISPPVVAPANGLPFKSGQSIPMNTITAVPDFGVSVVISGQPVDGDSFLISPSRDQSMFTTLRNTITAISQGISTSAGTTPTEYSNNLAANLTNIDQALGNVLNMQTTVGSRMNELDALSDTAADMQIQYASSLSELQDLDYTKAVSDMARKQLQLEAAQLSFKQISQLSLFSIL